MKNELTKQQVDDILKILDDLVALGGWESSAFLKVIGKKLQTIRDDFSSRTSSYRPDNSKITSNLANRVAIRSGQQEVFIALYSSDGSNIQSWERIVVNLPKQMVSRPIYANEEDVTQAVRGKENKINEAYVSIYVSQTDVLSMGDKTPTDKQGKPLLTLKDKSLILSNINRFVHISGVYYYSHGRLVKESHQEV
jgi:intracellular multiplication protein IcmQ